MLRNNLTLAMSMSGTTTKTTKTANKMPAVRVNIAASCYGEKARTYFTLLADGFLAWVHYRCGQPRLPEPTVNVEPEHPFGTEKDTAKEWTSRRVFGTSK